MACEAVCVVRVVLASKQNLLNYAVSSLKLESNHGAADIPDDVKPICKAGFRGALADELFDVFELFHPSTFKPFGIME